MKHSILYTRTGDSGLTSLVSGNRVRKNHPRIEAYGTLDELNSHIGLLAAQELPDSHEVISMLRYLQNRLFDIGAYLATDPDEMPQGRTMPLGISTADVARVEQMTDIIDGALPPLRRFVLPGGTRPSAIAQIARTVCRRAERRILTLAEEADIDPLVMQFINRMSDFLFALGRFCNVKAGQEEIFWEKNC